MPIYMHGYRQECSNCLGLLGHTGENEAGSRYFSEVQFLSVRDRTEGDNEEAQETTVRSVPGNCDSFHNAGAGVGVADR